MNGAFDRYHSALTRRPLCLEVAEQVIVSVLADPTLTHREKETLVLLAFRRFYATEADAVNAAADFVTGQKIGGA